MSIEPYSNLYICTLYFNSRIKVMIFNSRKIHTYLCISNFLTTQIHCDTCSLILFNTVYSSTVCNSKYGAVQYVCMHSNVYILCVCMYSMCTACTVHTCISTVCSGTTVVCCMHVLYRYVLL